MTTPEKLRSQVQDLFEQAQAVQDAEEGLIHILRSLEREADADAAAGMVRCTSTREND